MGVTNGSVRVIASRGTVAGTFNLRKSATTKSHLFLNKPALAAFLKTMVDRTAAAAGAAFHVSVTVSLEILSD